MSDIAKWAILVAGILALIVVILTLPFAQYLGTGGIEIAIAMDNILTYCSTAFYQVRAFLNIFLLPIGRNVLSGLMVYLFASWIVKISIKVSAWIFHFIFK